MAVQVQSRCGIPCVHPARSGQSHARSRVTWADIQQRLNLMSSIPRACHWGSRRLMQRLETPGSVAAWHPVPWLDLRLSQLCRRSVLQRTSVPRLSVRPLAHSAATGSSPEQRSYAVPLADRAAARCARGGPAARAERRHAGGGRRCKHGQERALAPPPAARPHALQRALECNAAGQRAEPSGL